MDDDVALLEAIRHLDQDALIRVFDAHASRIFRYALRLCGDPIRADDIVAEVFNKLLEALKTGKGPRKNIKSYLYQIAYHEIVNEARITGKQTELTEELPAGVDEAPETQAANREESEELVQAIKTALNENQRHVITLRFLENFTVLETAEILGKNVNHIKVIQNRAIRKLRQALEKTTEQRHEQQTV